MGFWKKFIKSMDLDGEPGINKKVIEKPKERNNNDNTQEEYDHLIVQFGPNHDIKIEANELVEKMRKVGTTIRLNPRFKNNDFHQVIEIKNKKGKWRILEEMIKR